MPRMLLLLLAVVCTTGCLPRTIVHKDPGPHDKGIRYYRPKPYLFLKPMVAGDQPVEGYVTIEQLMLPDFSEEYSIHVRSGLGTNDTQITLTDGWNLTALNINLDSQFDDNLTAATELAKAVPTATGTKTRMAVKATNVPMGLYEAVVSTGPDFKKHLYGFRYVGFLPYSSCPIETTGLECQDCTTTELYGLVFEEGAMVFRSLAQISDPTYTNLSRVNVAHPANGNPSPSTVGPPPLGLNPGPMNRQPMVSDLPPINQQ